jgi:plasmid stabilization system protein ParE
MPQSAWSAKRERQYEHIKDSEKKQGRSTKRAKEIAARTVNKERAASGETRGSGRTKEQLYNQAKRLNVPGRSQMTKAQLQRAVDARK